MGWIIQMYVIHCGRLFFKEELLFIGHNLCSWEFWLKSASVQVSLMCQRLNCSPWCGEKTTTRVWIFTVRLTVICKNINMEFILLYLFIFVFTLIFPLSFFWLFLSVSASALHQLFGFLYFSFQQTLIQPSKSITEWSAVSHNSVCAHFPQNEGFDYKCPPSDTGYTVCF